ncbi:hypothetical protein BYT27DRAFT_7184130 [Phlegmacium glaucopus]|nr:hypothetical protein BYT27DRAFT_7184130 [Phlegmacium glaucopus]
MLKALLSRENTDKRILYIAYFIRQPSAAVPVPFHSALFVVPKRANAMEQFQNCTRLEAVNSVLPDPARTGTGIEVWEYTKGSCHPRPARLAGLQKIGKLSNTYNDDVLNALFLPILPEPMPVGKMPPGWRCHDWVTSAIQLLANAEAIALNDRTAAGIYQSGLDALIERKKTVNLLDCTQPVFTVDMDGNEISSQIGPIET